MSATDPVPSDDLLVHLLDAAPATLATISGAADWSPRPADTATSGEGWRGIEARVGEVAVRLLVDAELARHLQVGPPPAEDLVEGATAPLRALASALGLAGPVADVREVAADTVDGPGTERAAVVALDGDVHRATLVLARPAVAATAPAPGPSTATPPVGTAPKLAAVPSGLELLHDVELAVTVELGRTRMLVKEVLDLVPGSVIELDRAAGSPVDVLVNGTMIARGEVVVIDEEFGVRITEVIGYGDDGPR